MKRLAILLIPMLAVGAFTATAHADKKAKKGSKHSHHGHANKSTAKVKGKGIVIMEAMADDLAFGAFEEGDLFADNDFKIKAKVKADGSASGTAAFVFGEEFSSVFGADVITLECEIDTATVLEDGTIVLQGQAFEQDFAGGAVIFEEIAPFEILVDSTGLFTLRWCLLPAFDLEITKGHLKAK